MARPTRVTIDLSAFEHNLARVRELAPKSQVLGMVKANAYGHGLLGIADYLKHCVDAFGVACIEEAAGLRQIGLTSRIVLMEGPYTEAECQQACELGCEIVVHHDAQVQMLTQTHLAKPVKVWLKFETGMHRLGFVPSEGVQAYQTLKDHRNVEGDPIVMSHLSDADNRNADKSSQQLATFDAISAQCGEVRSLANSAAILELPNTHYDWVRPGIMMYGISPFADQTGEALGLKPVMHFETQIFATKTVRAGETVGYGSTWEAPMDTRIGIVSVGYGDGYPRHVTSGTPVLIAGQKAGIVGRVSMDMICVDLSGLSDVGIGESVTLWGPGLPVELIATQANTIPYELVSQLTERVPKIYK